MISLIIQPKLPQPLLLETIEYIPQETSVTNMIMVSRNARYSYTHLALTSSKPSCWSCDEARGNDGNILLFFIKVALSHQDQEKHGDFLLKYFLTK